MKIVPDDTNKDSEENKKRRKEREVKWLIIGVKWEGNGEMG